MLTVFFSCRRLDNKLNIFEGLRRNPLFIVITLIMIGGQVLIIFVGGEAFQVKPQRGWEWGVAIGLGAVSLPTGALVRMMPDSWFSSIGRGLHSFFKRVMPKWGRKKTDDDSDSSLDEEKTTETAPTTTTDGTPARVGTATRRPGPPRPRRTTSSKPPHRVMSFLRGGRTSRSIGFRTWLAEKKEALGDKMGHGTSN